MREAGYDVSKVSMSGASAGALTATLTAADVDFYDATRLALKLAGEEDVWDRRGGLQVIWGPMIERWLDELLPPDALDKVRKGELRDKVRKGELRGLVRSGKSSRVQLDYFLAEIDPSPLLQLHFSSTYL